MDRDFRTFLEGKELEHDSRLTAIRNTTKSVTLIHQATQGDPAIIPVKVGETFASVILKK
jgi:hypothetical protein